jgi:hypothetical protein
MSDAAADRESPMVAVTLLHRGGYFYHTLDASGRQSEVRGVTGGADRSARDAGALYDKPQRMVLQYVTKAYLH